MLWAFFPWNLKAFLKAELVFKESHTFLQQVIAFQRTLSFWMAVIDFSRCSRFFCHPGSFFNENYWFLVVKFVFSMRVLVFLASSIL